jgi:hypothetical protein
MNGPREEPGVEKLSGTLIQKDHKEKRPHGIAV